MIRSEFRRKKSTRLPKKVFYLVCEGKNTEPLYFQELSKVYNSLLIKVITHGDAGVPSTIAKRARDLKKQNRIGSSISDSFAQNDEVWAIFDRDAHPCYEAARQNCAAWGIGLAYSDPCFELWLILHEQDHEASDDHHSVQRVLEGIDPAYSRNSRKVCDFPKFISRIEDAERRAERQLQARIDQDNTGGRPSTTVFRLTRKLRGLDSE